MSSWRNDIRSMMYGGFFIAIAFWPLLGASYWVHVGFCQKTLAVAHASRYKKLSCVKLVREL